MNIITLVMRYGARVAIIAYLITTNWRFLEFNTYFNEPFFWKLYKGTCVVVAFYLLLIELLHFYMILDKVRKTRHQTSAKRKFKFFYTALVIVAVANLVILEVLFAIDGKSMLSAKYFQSGFIFFLLVFSAYELWICYKPRTTVGFWMMEDWVMDVVEGIEEKAKPVFMENTEDFENDRYVVEPNLAYVVVDSESEGDLQNAASTEFIVEVESLTNTEASMNNEKIQRYIEEITILLMDILLIISHREGVYIYLRSGRCIYTESKLYIVFNEVNLDWFSEYHKGARVNLAHLVSADCKEGLLHVNEEDYKLLKEVWSKSDFELNHLLAISPVYIDRIKQQIENREQLNKAVLSQSIQLKSVIELN